MQHFRNYTRGLLTDLARKTAEPLAKYAGTPPRCLQQFLKACLWDHEGLTDGVQQTLRAAVAELPPDPVGTVGILDETSASPRKGPRRPACSEYLGCVGKVANGIVTVHSWSWPTARSRPCSTANCSSRGRGGRRPGTVPGSGHPRRRPLSKSKWEIATGVAGDRTERNGWRFDWLTFDEGYGGKPGFLRVLDLAGLRYVGKCPSRSRVRPGRSRTAAERRGHICSAGREETGSEVVPASSNKPARQQSLAGEGRGSGFGDRPSAATPTDLGAESRDGGEEILPHQRTAGGSACGALLLEPRSCSSMWSMCSASPRAKSA